LTTRFLRKIYITLGLFLLGLYAGRKIFLKNGKNNSLDKKTCKTSLWVILGSVIFLPLSLEGRRQQELK